MINIYKLKTDVRKSKTGFLSKNLLILEYYVNNSYTKGLSHYLSEKPKRKCGVQVGLSLENQLLLCLLYLREYHTLLELGTQFGISESYAQKRYVFTKAILLKELQCPDIASLKTTVETNLVAIDVTEQPIERPVEGQEDYYSGKKTPYDKSATLCMPFNRSY